MSAQAKKRLLLAAVILGAMAVLAFASLGNRFMWIDESLTAALGKNVLLFGYPRAWDGTNLVTATNGNCFNEHLVYVKDNWLAYYIAAFAQLFGSSAFHLRLWFVILGLAGAAAFYALARRLAGGETAALTALAFYAFSVPVLLFVRQARYYSPGLLFVILTVLCYMEAAGRPGRRSSWWWWAGFAASAVLLFHSLYMFFFVTLATLVVAYAVFDRRRESWRAFVASLSAIAAGTLPCFLYFQAWSGRVETTAFHGLGYFWAQVCGYLWQIQTYLFPFITLGVLWLALAAFSWRRRPAGANLPGWPAAAGPAAGDRGPNGRGLDGMPLWAAGRDPAGREAAMRAERAARSRRLREWRDLWLLGGQIALTVATASLFSNYYNNRFLIPCLPACYLLAARLTAAIHRRDRLFGKAVAALLLATNLWGVAPYLAVKWSGLDPARVEAVVKPPLPFFKAGWNTGWVFTLGGYLDDLCRVRSYPLEYLSEITTDYDDANEGIVRFLWNYANPGDTVYVYGRDYETVAYYTGLQVVNRVDPEWKPWPGIYQSFPNAAPYQQLTAYPYRCVDWVIMRSPEEDATGTGRPQKLVWEDESLFERITVVDYPDAPDAPEIWMRPFRTDTSYPPFYVFRNRATTSPIGSAVVGKAQLEPRQLGAQGGGGS